MSTAKKRSPLRRILRLFLFFILALLLFLFLAPILFKPQIMAFAKRQLNKQLTANVDFKDVKISLFRHFPRLDLKLVDLSIVGRDDFKGDTLLYSPATHVVTNIKTLFRSDVKVYAIELVDPLIHARVDSNGRQNFDILKRTGSTGDTSTADFSLDLENYSITNGIVRYEDDQAKIYTEMKNFEHAGKGNFTAVKYLMKASTKADSVYFKYGAITYLNNAVIDIPMELEIDNKSELYKFKGEEFFINTVPLYAKGQVEALNDSVDKVDMDIKTKQAEFKDILTLLPGVYTENLKKFQTSGKAIIDGKVSGVSSRSRIPDFNFKIDVTDGFIKNPEFNEPIQKINVNAAIVNTGGINDSTVITMRNGSALIGSEPIQFGVGIYRPVSAMILDLAVKGKVQLEKLKQILKMGDMDLRGLLHADVQARGPLAAFQEQQANAIQASGFMNADNFYYKDNSTLPFNASNVSMNFSNAEAAITINQGNYNKTGFDAKGNIYNFFNFLFVNSPLRGKINASSPEVNLANWASNNTTVTSAAPTKPFIVPSNLLLDIDAHAGKLISEQVILNDLDGKIIFADRKMFFEDVKGKGLGGTMEVSGSYSSAKTPLQPDITLNYKLNSLDVKQTFNAFVTAKFLMPIGNYLSGTLSSEMTAAGKLGDNFLPIMNSLNGNGNLLLLNGLLQKFKPLEVLADRLGIERLKNIATKEIRNRFSFENGRVNVLPFKFTIFNDYDFEIAGQHGFDNSMDYGVKLSLPRKELGEKGNQLFTSLLSKFGKVGLNLKPDEKVSFFIKMTGKLTAPTLDIQLDKTLSNEFDLLKKQAEDQIKSKIDSAKNVLKDTLKNIKKDILTGIKDKILNKQDTSNSQQPQQPPKDSSKKKQVIKSVIDIFNRKNKKDSL